METSIRQELLQHVIDTIKDQDLTDFDELHFYAFNQDYYIIGYYNAEHWFKHHDVSMFDALGDVIDWERDTFGEVSLKSEDINSEKLVNLYVYMLGEELLSEFDLEQEPAELLADLESELN